MTVLVVDASIMIKWFIVDDEGDRAHAVRLRDALLRETGIGVVPTLALYEVGNTLARRIPEDCGRALQALRTLPLRWLDPDERDVQCALELVRRYGVTFYDAAYHALAINRNGGFVTSDRRYLERVASEGHAYHLLDWKPH